MRELDMQTKVDSALRYVLKYYPSDGHELTKTRLTKLIYLLDWESALKTGRQVTDINWYFNHYGPFVSDVFDAADDDSELRIVEKVSNFGTKKYVVEAKHGLESLTYDLTFDEEVLINKIIEETKYKSWNDFIDYVYETYPIRETEKYGFLDLVKLAEESKKQV